MKWKIDDNRPIWQQLSEQLLMQIISGAYPPGSRLPSVRDLAADAGVNPNTMQRALSELEDRGLVQTNRTAGRQVTEAQELLQAMRAELAEGQMQEFLHKMKALGYTAEEIRGSMEMLLAKEE